MNLVLKVQDDEPILCLRWKVMFVTYFVLCLHYRSIYLPFPLWVHGPRSFSGPWSSQSLSTTTPPGPQSYQSPRLSIPTPEVQVTHCLLRNPDVLDLDSGEIFRLYVFRRRRVVHPVFFARGDRVSYYSVGRDDPSAVPFLVRRRYLGLRF